jgi:flavin reductase (DIM6/NTAB) family NADH-FMN oxidoreductase RutF
MMINKTKFPAQPMFWPHPTVLVGSLTGGKPDFTAVAWTGIAASNPATLTIGLQHHRWVLKGIMENQTFSVNIPSATIVKETDYCGMVSGADTDKAEDCNFKVFYGNLKTAPLIEQCPINIECEVVHTHDLGSHQLIVGVFKDVHISSDCLTEGKPDIVKINPFFFGPGKPETLTKVQYYGLGSAIANAFSAGREIIPKAKG